MSEKLISESEGRIKTPSLQEVIDCKNEVRYRELREVFISSRLQELEKKTKPIVFETLPFDMYEGFIHPDSIVRPAPDKKVPGLKVDDRIIFQNFLDKLRAFREIPRAVQETVDEYFKSNHETIDADRVKRRFVKYTARQPEDHLSIKEIADAHVAMCTEKSAVAQNLIAFLGTHSWLVSSYVRIEWRDDRAEEGQHNYNIIETPDKKLVLYDANHPFEIMDEKGKVIGVTPAVFEITPNQFSVLQRGYEIHVHHKEEIRSPSGIKTVLREYIYGGRGSTRK